MTTAILLSVNSRPFISDHILSLLQSVILRSKYCYPPQRSNGEPILVSLSYLPKDSVAAATAAKSLQSCPTRCHPIDV